MSLRGGWETGSTNELIHEGDFLSPQTDKLVVLSSLQGAGNNEGREGQKRQTQGTRLAAGSLPLADSVERVNH